MEGRIEGRKSDDGLAYELWQGGVLLKSTPLAEAVSDQKLNRAIRKNGWRPL